MKRETIAIHAGYDGDPTTKAVAVPIYQTVAFEFDSAEHGAALFNLEVEGNIYTRIGNPTNTVLEKRVAALEGGVDGLSVSSGMAAIEYSLINIAEAGQQHRFYSAAVRRHLHAAGAHLPQARNQLAFRGQRSPGRRRETDRREYPRRLLRERGQSGGQCRRHRRAGHESRTSTACRWWSITRWRRRFCCGRSNTAPTWSCIP